MKITAHHDHLHEHVDHTKPENEGISENMLTVLILLSALFIPFAFIVHFFPG